jgi:hypothetical protein
MLIFNLFSTGTWFVVLFKLKPFFMPDKKTEKLQDDPQYNKSRGRRDGEAGKTSQQTSNRERNVGHSNSEEHSKTTKGNRG